MDKEEIMSRLKALKELAKFDFNQMNEEDAVSIDYVEGYLDAIEMIINHFKKD